MPRNMVVGLLAAVGATMSALVSLVHGDLVPVMIMGSGAASGLAAYLALLPSKKSLVWNDQDSLGYSSHLNR
jgi:hypothetical protein